MPAPAMPAAGDGLPALKRRSRNPNKAALNAFMGKLFEPLPDAEIEDKELARLEKGARLRQWNIRLYEWRAAVALAKHLHYVFAVKVATNQEPGDYSQASAASLAEIAATKRLLLQAAPDKAALAWKRANAKQRWSDDAEIAAAIEEDIANAIAADERRLLGLDGSTFDRLRGDAR